MHRLTMEANHKETLRKERVIQKKREKTTPNESNRVYEEFKKNPGAGILLGCTTIYMDRYHRARCTSAKLTNRYTSSNYFQQH